MKFRKKPVVIEATRWFKNGDHPQDYSADVVAIDGTTFQSEGLVVRYYRTPDIDGQEPCRHCGNIMHYHGWIDTLEGGHIVCPGDWIITGVKGEHYPCKPDIFTMTYEAVEE
jgi:hypothetical protein